MEEPPEELRITHRMLDKFLKVDTFTFSANIFFVILLFYIFTISAYHVLYFFRFLVMSLGLTAFLSMTW